MSSEDNGIETPQSPEQVVADALQRIKSLATLPAVAMEILDLVNDPDATADDFNLAISKDPTLVTQVLKVVNSSFYGMPRQVDTIQQAVVILGLSAIRNIAIASSVNKLFLQAPQHMRFDPAELWQHTSAVAAAARDLAARTKLVSPEEAFLAGMLHDVGVIVEFQLFGSEFVDLVDSFTCDLDVTFRNAERSVLGATHEHFGAGLCRRWNLPDVFELVAGHHHEPLLVDEEKRTLPLIVHVADILAARLEIGFSRSVDSQQVAPEVLEQLQLEEADLDDLLVMLPESIEAQESIGG